MKDLRRAGIKNFAVGCVFVCKSTGRILLVRRSKTSDYPLTWAILGGGVDAGESLPQALLRELREEARISSIPNGKRVHDDVSDDFAYITYLCRVGKEFVPVLNSEHVDYRWCSIDDLPSPLHECFEKTLKTHLIPKYLGGAKPMQAKTYAVPKSWIEAGTPTKEPQRSRPSTKTQAPANSIQARVDMSAEVAGQGLCPACKKPMESVVSGTHDVLVCLDDRIVIPTAD